MFLPPEAFGGSGVGFDEGEELKTELESASGWDIATRYHEFKARKSSDSIIKQLRRLGIRADGQVLITRNIASGIANVAKARTARHVVLETPAQGSVRGFLEGNYESAIRRKLRATAEVESAPFT
jgi:hypothetical protein